VIPHLRAMTNGTGCRREGREREGRRGLVDEPGSSRADLDVCGAGGPSGRGVERSLGVGLLKGVPRRRRLFESGCTVCSGVVRWRRTQRLGQKAAQRRPLAIAEPSQQFQALRWRACFANHFNNFSRTTPTTTGEPFGGLQPLIERGAMGFRRTWATNRLATHHREVKFDQLSAKSRRFTDHLRHSDQWRGATTRVARLTSHPRRSEPAKMPGAAFGAGTVVGRQPHGRQSAMKPTPSKGEPDAVMSCE
jgi:hypothetical protein